MSNISPIDGRYKKSVSELETFFSEQALMRHRVMVEVEYLLALIEHKSFQKTRSLSKKTLNSLKGLYVEFSATHFKQIKKIEKKTSHDVNAVVVFVSEKLKKIGRDDLVPFVHFGLTSEDINNISYSLMTQGAVKDVMIPSVKGVLKELKALSKKTKSLSLLSLTHGQPATTTTLGKELAIFVSRVEREIALVKKIKLLAKLSGATGSYAAHKVAFPDFNWPLFSKRFIKKLGLEQSPISTQIEPGDSLAELLHSFVRINNIFSDFSLDMWLYISRNIFVQKNIVGEVGSSTMPHKINPIFFENAEGNLDIANNNFSFLASRITRSRLQRDLSGSTVFRNIGVGFAHSLISYKNLIKGVLRVSPNKAQMKKELDENWSILAEAIQTVLRKSGDASAYDKIKKLTRGKPLTKESYLQLVNSLNVTEKDRLALLELTPHTYLGEINKVLEDL
ncbi:adenylosuccinate lyase [Candidatus Marinimicrobia bacterium]|nr:adenylosuccinate lyase [Candidatus Neomarinimicrobiota bacterium]MDA9735620.1 adenylosuccinate lyase [Candidatus Neomarinimicrobiota bacterium]